MKNRILVTILPVLACFALLPGARAVIPPPDGCYPNFTTATGCNALNFLGAGAGNTAVGWEALFSNVDANFNTAIGGGALILNNSDSNTAVGAAALLLNTSGALNVAVGTDAMVFNDSGSSNIAMGGFALESNTTGGANVAIGDSVMANLNGSFNTAVGFDAGNNLTTAGFGENIYIGDTAGTLDFNGNSLGDEEGVIRIGSFFSGTSACFINGIVANGPQPIVGGTPVVVIDTTTGQLGWGPDFTGNKVAEQQKKIEEQQASINQLKSEMQTMVVQLKEQAAQIQRVSAQLEMRKPAARVVVNKP